jgi:hypothetical protein
VIVWHLLADPAATFQELGAGYYASGTAMIEALIAGER